MGPFHQVRPCSATLGLQAKGTSKMTSEQIDAIWNFSNPANSQMAFEDALKAAPESANELRTQICRSLGLQRKFDEGWAELAKIPANPEPIVEVRVQLESGRLKNSSGDKPAARPYFEKALKLAQERKFDFYVVDAAHMLGIVTTGEESLNWNEKAIQMATASTDKRTQNWNGSLLNNLAWTYHDMGEFEKALTKFQAALEFRQKQEDVERTRIAKWSVARCLRSLKRYDEALQIQRELEKGPNDGYVWEELAELLLATNKPSEANPYFRRAYEELSKDEWFRENEAKRLARLKDLGT